VSRARAVASRSQEGRDAIPPSQAHSAARSTKTARPEPRHSSSRWRPSLRTCAASRSSWLARRQWPPPRALHERYVHPVAPEAQLLETHGNYARLRSRPARIGGITKSDFCNKIGPIPAWRSLGSRGRIRANHATVVVDSGRSRAVHAIEIVKCREYPGLIRVGLRFR
jgi:hypothetical protein